MTQDAHVLLFSQLWTGHIPAYHVACQERLVALGCRVTSIVPQIADLRSTGANELMRLPYPRGVFESGRLLPFWKRLRIPGIERRIGLLRLNYTRTHWRLAARIAAEQKAEGAPPDLLFFVYLPMGFLADGMRAQFVERTLPYAWAGIWNGPEFGHSSHRTILGRVAPAHRMLLATNCRQIWVPDPKLAADFRRFTRIEHTRAMPELADLRTAPEVDRKVDAAFEGKRGPIISLLGNISLRKGVLDFLELARVALGTSELRFLIAGEFTQSSAGPDYTRIQRALDRVPPNVTVLTSRITEGPEFNAYVRASSILYLVYREFSFQSNLLTKAAAFGKPSLVAYPGLMHDTVKEWQLGESVAPGDPARALDVISQLLIGRNATGSMLRPRFADYAAINRAEALDPLFKECLGCKSKPFPGSGNDGKEDLGST